MQSTPKKTSVAKNWLIFPLLLVLTFLSGHLVYAEASDTEPVLIPNSLFVYTPEEMLTFDIQGYLKENTPDLVDFAEIISHWSGYTSISPKIIIALIEHQTGLISADSPDVIVMQRPLGDMSSKTGFSEQIKDVASQLATLFYQNRKDNSLTDDNALQNYLVDKEGDLENKMQGFESTLFQLFPELRLAQGEVKKQLSGAPQSLPPENLLQLPYPVGESWYFGGSHTSSGSAASFPHSSLDFVAAFGGWGTDTTSHWVSSSTAGTAKRHSSCSVEVIAPGGEWSTFYYHLDNVQVTTNQSISRNQALANYADNQAQALCQGGSSTGPHVHFSLKQNGLYYHLNDVELSGYKVHTGQTSYDTDCNYFWLDDNGTKRCAWTSLYNPGVIITIPLPSAPAGISASDGQYTNRVNVNWSMSAGATSYRAYRCTSIFSSSCTQIYSGPATSCNDYTGTQDTTYYYRTKACSFACSSYSLFNMGYRSSTGQNPFPWNLFMPPINSGSKAERDVTD